MADAIALVAVRVTATQSVSIWHADPERVKVQPVVRYALPRDTGSLVKLAVAGSAGHRRREALPQSRTHSASWFSFQTTINARTVHVWFRNAKLYSKCQTNRIRGFSGNGHSNSDNNNWRKDVFFFAFGWIRSISWNQSLSNFIRSVLPGD